MHFQAFSLAGHVTWIKAHFTVLWQGPLAPMGDGSPQIGDPLTYSPNPGSALMVNSSLKLQAQAPA